MRCTSKASKLQSTPCLRRRIITPRSPHNVGVHLLSSLLSTRHVCAASAEAVAPTDGPATTNARAAGRMTYKPSTFADIVNDAVGAVEAAMQDGLKRLEVEFPPLPGRVDDYKGASDMYIDSNAQLAIAAAKQLVSRGRKVHILFPDGGEYTRSYRMFKTAVELAPGVSLGHLQEAQPPNPFQLMTRAVIGGAPESFPAASTADIFMVLNASTNEIPTVEQYMKDVVKDKVMIFFNLELDTLRGDLGLPSFPPKSLQYRFLSTFRPVYYLRARDYSKTVAIAPFIVNYSGCLFREYPGPWQVMMKQDNGVYACIAEDVTRYTLGEVKEELQGALGINTEAEGSVEQFLRRGAKFTTWFEDDYEQEEDHSWRL